jgi:phage protein D
MPTITNTRFDPTCIIKINGVVLSDELVKRFLRWEYEDYEKIDQLKLTFDNQDGEITDDKQFILGSIIEFRHGYINDLSDPKYFTLQNLNGWREITITGIEVISIFDTEKNTKTYIDYTMDDLVGEIAGRNKLNYKTQERKDGSGIVIKDDYFQPGIEDMAFLYTLGVKIGYEVWIDDERLESKPTLYFMPRDYGQKPYMKFTYEGLNGQIIDFDPSITTAGRRSQFEAGGVDLVDEQTFFFTTKDSTVQRAFFYKGEKLEKGFIDYDKALDKIAKHKNGKLIHRPIKSKSECEDMLAGEHEKKTEAQITANLTVVGEPHLKSKRVIVIENAQKFSGKYYVNKVTHTGDGGYSSVAQLSRNALFSDSENEKFTDNYETILVNRERVTVSTYLKITGKSPRSSYYKRLLKV